MQLLAQRDELIGSDVRDLVQSDRMRAQRALALALRDQSVEALDDLVKDVAVHGHVLVTTPKSIRNLRMYFAADHCRLRSLPRAFAEAERQRLEGPKAGREGGSRGRGLPGKAEQSEHSKGKGLLPALVASHLTVAPPA